MARATKASSALLQRAMRSSAARPQILARSVGIRAVQLPLLARSGFQHGATNSLARTPTVGVSSVGFFSTSASASAPLTLGDRVELTIVGKLANGEPFGQTAGDRPIAFIVGGGDVIPGIEEAVIGLVKGESKSVEIPPEKAFGKTKQIYSIPRKQMNLPEEEDKKLAVGEVLQLQNGETARIVKVTDEAVDIDLSHPYAGETLYVDLTIVETTARDQLSAEDQLVLPEEVAPGDGVTFPSRGDTLVMHYTGKLASNGEVFDSSRTRNQPFQFQIGVGQVIRGWDEGVLRMSKGQKALLRIPSAKGYGKTGAGGVIPPNADLLFEVELLDILRPGQ